MENVKRRLGGRAGRAVLAAWAALAAGACSEVTGGRDAPEEARIVVEGTAPDDLRLVVSTDFFETRDNDGRLVTVVESADTVAVALPLDRTVRLGERGSVFVSLFNEAEAVAAVRMRIWVDGDVRFDRRAEIAEGGTLDFTFAYTPLRL